MIAKPKKKTGVFKRNKGDGVVVMWRGQVIAEYVDIPAFVVAHLDALATLERQQENVLQDEYKDI